jgi:hypothetical protein
MIKQLKRILKPVQRHTKHYQTLIRKSEYDNVGLMTLSRFRRTPEPRVRMGQIMSLFVKLTLEEIYTGVTKNIPETQNVSVVMVMVVAECMIVPIVVVAEWLLV